MLGSECINWFCKSSIPVIDDDGEKIDNPILLFDIFIRKGVKAIFRGTILTDNPYWEDPDPDQDAEIQQAKNSEIRALKFDLAGRSDF